MRQQYLLDKDFLKELDQQNEREVYAKIISLSFDEQPIEEIQGHVTGGSINIDGNSSVRRTCSISLIAEELNIQDFYWGLHTKIQVYIGLKNNINSKYPSIIWFNQGIFLITGFSTNQTITNYTVSIQGKDKMTLLNGEVGGVITSLSADFGQIEETDANGIITVSKIPIKEIIREVVHEWAREPFEKIVIEDLEDCGLELMEYRGQTPMYFLVNEATNEIANMFMDPENHKYYYLYPQKNLNDEIIAWHWSTGTNQIPLDWENFQYDTRTSFLEVQSEPTRIRAIDGGPDGETYRDPITNTIKSIPTYVVIKVVYGEVVGYRETELTYAGDLIGNIGNSICQSCLEPIKNMLGDFEYFYDENGYFHFRRKQTFVNLSWNNLIDNPEESEVYAESSMYTSNVAYSFENANLITAFQNKPNISNIKNDYSIWGTKKTTGGNEYPVHLRYAIDKKPFYYKTIDGRVYCTGYKSEALIRREAEEQVTSTLAEKIASHQKMPLPDGLSDDWWDVVDWGELYKELNNGEAPNRQLKEYVHESTYVDLALYFPGGVGWNASRPCNIFDVNIPSDGDLNGPLRYTGHNPICTHYYTSYFVEGARAGNYKSYIYKPDFPDDIKIQMDEKIIIEIIEKQHYSCDWREIIYQMARDSLKYSHNQWTTYEKVSNIDSSKISLGIYYIQNYDGITYSVATEYNPNEDYYIKIENDFLTTVAKNNPDYYPSGHTGYEMYYTDIVSFWRDIYNPEYKFTEHIAQVQRSLYEHNPERYYWFEQCDNLTAYDKNEVYYLKNEYDEYEKIGCTEYEYRDNPSYYYYLVQGSINIPYDKTKIYFTKTTDDFNVDKSDKNFGWSKDIINYPSGINFWFDFLDSKDGSLTAYNVRNIGSRPKSVNDKDVKAIYYRDTPTVIFINSKVFQDEIAKQKRLKPGYTFVQFPSYMEPLFNISTQKKDAKEVLEQWLYQYTNATENISITAIPVYYLTPNTRIFVHDENSGLNGEYIVNKLTYNLAYNGTMSIQAVKAIDRIY